MPYKTIMGDHYHIRFGCSGAFIPCGTSGLEPCAICCQNALVHGTQSTQAASAISSHNKVAGNASVLANEEENQLATPGTPALSPQMVCKAFEMAHTDEELADDSDGLLRMELVNNIEAAIQGAPNIREQEKMRSQLQTEWNQAHPQAPILEWTKRDHGFDEDSERTVTLLQGPDRASEALTGEYVWTLLDKATGEDLTDRLRHICQNISQLRDEIQDVEIDVRARNRQEQFGAEIGEAYDKWLEHKRRTSKKAKYHKEFPSFDERLRLRRQFDKETNYKYYNLQGEMKPNSREEAQLANLCEQRDAWQQQLDAFLDYYKMREQSDIVTDFLI